jgi:predicted phosphodiesterase
VKLAVISDLHLGAKDCTDSFGHDDGEFLRFLAFLEANFEQIVLLGDIYETLTARLPWSAQKALAAARSCHPEIAERFRGPKYKYIHGNHDLVAQEAEGTPEHWMIEADGKRLLFTHGHAYDGLIRFARHLVELGVCIGGWVRRAGWHRLYQHLDELDQKRCAVSKDPAECPFQSWAFDLAGQAGADIVVTGHTHVPLVTSTGPKMYLNSGSCSRGRYSYLGLDTRSDVYGVHHAW